MLSKICCSYSCAVIAALIGVAGLSAAAGAETIAGWDLTQNLSGGSNGLVATTTASGISGAAFTRNGTVTVSSATYSYDSKGWLSGDIANNVQAGFSVSSGTWDVTDLIFSAFRSGTGPSAIDVYTSVDGGSPTLFQTLSPITTSAGAAATNYDIMLNLTISSSLEVYFIADSSGLASSSTGTLRLNNVSNSSTSTNYFQFEGKQPATVPLPSASLGGIVLTGVLAVARRRKI
jgi:hypothetical protein